MKWPNCFSLRLFFIRQAFWKGSTQLSGCAGRRQLESGPSLRCPNTRNRKHIRPRGLQPRGQVKQFTNRRIQGSPNCQFVLSLQKCSNIYFDRFHRHDIGIIRLNSFAKMTDTVCLLCLPEENSKDFAGSNCTVTGYGRPSLPQKDNDVDKGTYIRLKFPKKQ